MKKNKLFLVGIIGIIILSCADYDLYDESVHPTPVHLSITGVADSSIALSWTRYQGSEDLFKNYRVYFGHNSGLDTTDSLADTLGFMTDTAVTVRKLSPGTLYYFRVIVTTPQGGIGASNIVDTTTLANGASNLTLYVPDSAGITDSTVRLCWSPCTEVFDGYKIRMDTTENVNVTDTLVKTVYSDTAVTITGLTQGRAYWFRVYAFHDTATVAVSNVMMAQTKAPEVNQQIDMTIFNVTDSSITMRWNMYRGNDFKRYYLRCSHNYGVKVTDSLVDSFSIQADTVYEAQHLTPQSRYFYRLFVPVSNVSGGYLNSNEVDTVTLENKEGKLAFYPPDSITDSSITLRWSRYALAPVNSYKVYMDTSQSVDNKSPMVKIAYDTIATVKGLIASQNYWFKIYAWGDTGIVAWTHGPLNVQMNPCGKTWQKTLAATDTSDSTVTLKWAQYPCNDFISYIVRMSTDTSSVGPADDTVKSISIVSDTVTLVRGLLPGNSYALRVFIKTVMGLSNENSSQKITVTTTKSVQ